MLKNLAKYKNLSKFKSNIGIKKPNFIIFNTKKIFNYIKKKFI